MFPEEIPGSGESIADGGVTALFNGFSIGTDSDINTSGQRIRWVARK